MIVTPTVRGRPRRSSREMLEDAATELFLEQGYASTTVDQIARRAGVSRNTFFNYFEAKSDLLWAEFDASAGRLGDLLSEPTADALAPMDAVRAAVLTVAGEFGPERLPWAIAESELIGAAAELALSGFPRFIVQAEYLRTYLVTRIAADSDEQLPSAAAWAVIAATVASARAWTRAGDRRGSLAPYVDAAITPVCAGYASVLAARRASSL